MPPPNPELNLPHADAFVASVSDWYAEAARDLPWRAASAGAWAVLVSEVMLQQTPVPRVLPVYSAWLQRWPTPAALAAQPPAEAIRAWGRLGYPRRAMRLHAAAGAIVERHDGEVPTDLAALRALPGVGDYTAAAVAAFAFRQRHAVLDTNVRRVLARAFDGHAHAAPSTTAAERQLASSLLPDDAEAAATYCVAVMELGALVCRARDPGCGQCPVAQLCAWAASGKPDSPRRRRAGQRYAGTDRQVRGRLLAMLRDSADSLSRTALAAAWPDPVQRERALQSLVVDGLVEPIQKGRFRLPA